MTITTYLSGRRKLTTTVDDSAVRAKDAKESMKKAISGSASMWAFKEDKELVGAIKVLKGVVDVKIDRY